ncbi:rhodanese-like domain-containing protein [Enterococcus dongliensis]|uniref:rhodanese-like domain-containing protein n=1 Tax=Enterococcus dongliensis TaxID=2559925 RepID=UPI0028920F32|nr:rhodanese-like domain-containing protein [Enterococcus dongliensis]MDT2613633.1 rhodanese-like domain-containing protein [Enterococcus dongliensis]
MINLFQKVPSISTEELAEKLAEPITLLDVRTPDEYRDGHIAKAISYPFEKIKRYQGKKEELYIICQGGVRSKKAAKILKGKGYEVVNVRGGMNQWHGPVKGGK